MGNRNSTKKTKVLSPQEPITKEESIIEAVNSSIPVEEIEKKEEVETVLNTREEILEPTEDPHQIMLNIAAAPLRAHLKRTLKPPPLSKREIKRQ
jgi:hypothetical protein